MTLRNLAEPWGPVCDHAHTKRLGKGLFLQIRTFRASAPQAAFDQAEPGEAGMRPPAGSSRIARVTRETAQSRPLSSVMSTSHTQVVRPECRQVARASIVPPVTGRRELVRFDMPLATLPSAHTTETVEYEVSPSATAA